MTAETEVRLDSPDTNSSLAADFPIVHSLIDLANLITIAGLCAAVGGVYAAVNGRVHLGAALLAAGLLCDMLDGNVARRFPRRPPHMSRLGVQFDSLSDVIHGGVLPGMLLTAVCGMTTASILAAQILCVCVVVRLAHFNVFGLSGGMAYRGVPVTFNSLVTAMVIALAPSRMMPEILLLCILALAGLNVSDLRIPKMKGASLQIFLCLNAVMIVWNLVQTGLN